MPYKQQGIQLASYFCYSELMLFILSFKTALYYKTAVQWLESIDY